METRLTVIVDNNGTSSLSGEWGLAILAEVGEKKLLIDAGAGELFAENLKKLGFDIREIDYAALSHAHYDHGNGMPRFFRDNEKAKFYVRKGSGEDCYFKKFIVRKYIGLPRNVLTEYRDRIEQVEGDCALCDGVYLIPHKTAGLTEIGKRESMYRRTPGGWVPDDFSHEQSVVLKTDKGLVIINSCCHGGALNIINEVRVTFPGQPIYGLIGGLHLFNKTEDEVRKVAREIDSTGVRFVCTGHCTKDKAYGILRETLGDRLHSLHVGLQMTF